MTNSLQMTLPGIALNNNGDDSTANYKGKDLGTFKDSLRAPVHRWFRYPAGYSYKFVNVSFEIFDIEPGNWVYDPFSGTGTTLICAKQAGINAYGVEAHSFVHWVANTKLFWEYDIVELENDLDQFLVNARKFIRKTLPDTDINGIFPELVYKCYHPKDLKTLYLLREFITNSVDDPHLRDFLKLGLTDTLRGAAAAGTGWPYISPKKNKGDKPPKNAFAVFQKTVREMCADLRIILALKTKGQKVEIYNILGDSRSKQRLNDEQVNLALTSPPYLNNYDYADRTRLETYFWGIADSWSDITKQFRDKLMVAATTQVTRSNYTVENALSIKIEQARPEVYEQLQEAILQLADLRLLKGGRKDYDLMVALYFNDIFEVLCETFRILKKGSKFCLVLGDSAPYGVHIPTDEFIGELGLGVGFSNYKYHELRRRGGKWKDNPQRHNVQLREGIIVLSK